MTRTARHHSLAPFVPVPVVPVPVTFGTIRMCARLAQSAAEASPPLMHDDDATIDDDDGRRHHHDHDDHDCTTTTTTTTRGGGRWTMEPRGRGRPRTPARCIRSWQSGVEEEEEAELLVSHFSFIPNHPVVLGPRFEETVARVPLLFSSLSSLLIVIVI